MIDDRILADASGGSIDARKREIEALYRAQGPRLWRSLLAVSGSPDIASDTVAEVFTQALSNRKGIDALDRWIWSSAFRIVRGEMRAQTGPRISLEVAEAYEMESISIDLLAALARLPRTQRVSVVLHHAAGYPVKEIAAILDASENSVKVHLFRGRKKLARLLGDDHEA